MSRFITIETYGGTVTAYHEGENWQQVLSEENSDLPEDAVAEWVWQFADNREEAVEQHAAKHDEWNADTQAGRDPKPTY